MSDDQASQQVKRELLVRSMLSTDATESQLSDMLALFRDVDFRKGEVIYEKGQAAESIYFILDGHIELRADDGAAPWPFKDRSVVGIIDAIVDRPYLRTAVAITDVAAFVVPSDDYFDFLEDNPSLTQQIVAFLGGWLRDKFVSLPEPHQLLQAPSKRELIKLNPHPLSLVERLLVIRKMRAFVGASAQSLVSVAEMTSEARHRPGDVLFRQGDPTDDFWLIARGRVRIQRAAPDIDIERGSGDLIENYGAFGASERMYTATAATDLIVLRIHHEDLLDRLEQHFSLTRAVMAFLSRERAKMNELISAGEGEDL